MPTYKLLSSGGTRMKTSKRVQVMYQYGGTVGAARCPKFRVDGNSEKEYMLVRPVVNSRPYQQGSIMMRKCDWLIQLCKRVESLTLKYLEDNCSQLTVTSKSNSTQSTVLACEHACFSKKCITPSLRICDTFFTQMILVGSFNKTEGCIPSHKDVDDYVTALISLGETDTLVGGDTFYSELTSSGNFRIKETVPYRHSNVQIGIFHDVTHGALDWKHGYRGVLNLSLKKQVLDHFYKYGNKYYVQYIKAGYPSGAFVAE